MSYSRLGQTMREAHQAYLNGSFLEAHSLFIDLVQETTSNKFPLLTSLCRAYLLLTEYKTKGTPERVEEHLERLKESIDNLGDTLQSVQLANEFNFIGSELLELKKFPEAFILLKVALKIVRKTKNQEFLRNVTYNLSYAYLGIQKPEEGAKLLGIAANLENEFANAELGIKRSIDIYHRNNKADSAVKILQDTLKAWNGNETAVQRIYSLKADLGRKKLAQITKTDASEAVRSLVEETLEDCERSRNRKLFCETLFQAGIALDTIGEPESEEFWKKARKISLGYSSKDIYIKSSVSLAFLLLERNKLTKAMPLLDDALDVAQETGNQVMIDRIEGILSSVEMVLPAPKTEVTHSKALIEDNRGTISEDSSPDAEKNERRQEDAISEVDSQQTSIKSPQTTIEDGRLPRLPQLPVTGTQFRTVSAEITPETVSTTPNSLIVSEEDRAPSLERTSEPLHALSPSEVSTEVSGITKEDIGDILTQKGYSVKYNSNIDQSLVVIDIVATKRKVRRKKKLFILFSETPSDAKIAAYLLSRLDKSGKKFIFLTNGSVTEVGRVGKGIKVITDVSELETM